jgi:hypothetical protein
VYAPRCPTLWYAARVQGETYDAMAVVNHSGTMGFGHYTACVQSPVSGTASCVVCCVTCALSSVSCLCPGEWLHLNDTMVSIVSGDVTSYLQTASAYVLMYRRNTGDVQPPVVEVAAGAGIDGRDKARRARPASDEDGGDRDDATAESESLASTRRRSSSTAFE